MEQVNTSVYVTADSLGNVIGISKNNPEFGYVRVEQIVPVFNIGWLKFSKRSALIKGKVEDLKKMNFTKGQILSGRIIVRETLTPVDPKNSFRNLKIAGDTGVVCTINDQPIYRDMIYTENTIDQDVTIQHDNSDQIRSARETGQTVKPGMILGDTVLL